ncbi:MAG: amidohydrolase family protein [Planctomycetota bacterium]|nr:amidohydrolase family protein [Planctomycetota bacterium]
MRISTIHLLAIGFVLSLLGSTPAEVARENDVLAIRGGKILTVTKGVIDGGTIIVTDGKITAVGPADEVVVPDGARVRDATGLIIIPGLVDTHSHIGIYSRPSVRANSDGNEGSGPVQPLVRALDAIYPADPGMRMATAGGITTANIMPGSGNVMGGQTAYVKLRGRTVEEMLIDLGDRAGGMKMANGENPKRNYGSRNEAPGTRMKVAALQRGIFVKAQEYKKKWERHAKDKEEGKKTKPPRRDISLEPVVEILEGKRTVHFHTHRADDILTVMRLADEFGFEVVLQHVTEAHLVADEIARRGRPVSLIIVESPGGKHEAIHLKFENPAICQKAGVKVAIHTDDPITHSRLFLRSGALAVRGGMSPAEALKALTIHPAEMLHLESRIGSIEVGKDGDLVLLSGNPFSVYTRVMATYIEGDLVFDRSRPEDLPYAVGGFDVRRTISGEPYPPEPMPSVVLEPKGARGVADGSRFAVIAGRIRPAVGPEISEGVILVEGGKISKVGARADIPIPDGWPVVSAAVVTPGFIDAHSSVGLSGLFNVRGDQDHDELVDPDQSALRVLDGFNPREPLLDYLLKHGVTTIQCMPGPGNPIAGQAAIFRTHGNSADEMLIRSPSSLVFNLGERPKAVYGERRQAPTTRMGTAAVIRKALVSARHPERKEGEEPGRDLGREALIQALDGNIPSIFVAHREDDIQTALRLSREFGLKCILSQATEGYVVADALRSAEVAVLVGPTLQRPGGLETHNASYENAARLRDAGVPLAITSGFESYVPKTHLIHFEAALAAVNGLRRDRALEAITIGAARILDIDDEYGSIEPGKVADLVLFDGDPFEYVSQVSKVFAGGELVFDRNPTE